MLTPEEIAALEPQRKYFIEENRTDASLFQWLTSKGTNFTCYIQYLNTLSEEQRLNGDINKVRTIIYAFHKPVLNTFFYWTLLIFILHKFNFKKPVMKIILAHLVLRSLGDILEELGAGFLNLYFANVPLKDKDGNTIGYYCQSFSFTPEMHPLRWFLTRYIGCICWFVGEIIADWYPLLRTRAVARDNKSIWLVYVTCAIFNLSKLSIIFYHYTLSPKELYKSSGIYDKNKVDIFYFTYWIIHLIIIYSSVIYDFSVYYVIKQSLKKIPQSSVGFLKKFKTISEYRILVSAIVSVIFLPIVSLTIVVKYYYYYKYGYHNLEFSFDEIRQSISNVQYFMIFIDQILLLYSKNRSTVYNSSNSSKSKLTKVSNYSKLQFSKIINSSVNNTLVNENLSEHTFGSSNPTQNSTINSSRNSEYYNNSNIYGTMNIRKGNNYYNNFNNNSSNGNSTLPRKSSTFSSRQSYHSLPRNSLIITTNRYKNAKNTSSSSHSRSNSSDYEYSFLNKNETSSNSHLRSNSSDYEYLTLNNNKNNTSDYYGSSNTSSNSNTSNNNSKRNMKSISNYDFYDGISCEWNYLQK